MGEYYRRKEIILAGRIMSSVEGKLKKDRSYNVGEYERIKSSLKFYFKFK